MTNWNERMRAEEARQAAEVAMQTQADQAKLTAQAALVEEENRKKQERLDVLEAQVSELFTSLGAMNMLEGIRRDVWGKGRVETFTKPTKNGREKGARIIYEYDYPVIYEEDILKRKLGHYFVPDGGKAWRRGSGSDAGGYEYSTGVTKFGWHEEKVGYNIRYRMERRSTSTEVGIGGAIEGSRDIVYFINAGTPTRIEEVSDPKAFIENYLLNDCISRERYGNFPQGKDMEAQRELQEIQRSIQLNPRRNH